MYSYNDEYQRWVNLAKDAALAAELEQIKGKQDEIEERFYNELEFGTAGLRGIIGAGTNRMNIYVVRRATAGLARHLRTLEGAAGRGVAIAYDSRHMSAEFAKETALVLCSYGIKAYVFDTLHSVPQLSFAIRHWGCIAGVVITASHNPPEYNGYKVYGEHGGQVAPEQANAILESIRLADYFDTCAMDENAAQEAGLLKYIGDETDEAYYMQTQKLLLHPGMLLKKGAELKLVYTPLHGSGRVPVQTLLHRVGVTGLNTVAQQAEPDGRFPTVKAPNPEDPDAFTLAIALAEREGANVILATDPDADRLGAAVRDGAGCFHVLTGNQIGCLLLHYILSSKRENGTLPENGLVVKSLVSTRMADTICERFGVQLDYVPTGFRFISEKIDECERTGKHTFLFGFEESFGFLAGTVSRDKDAVCAAMLLAEACAYYMERGRTLCDVLYSMYNEYGYHKESVKSYALYGKQGLERIARVMQRLRDMPPKELGGIAVIAADDLLRSSHITIRKGHMCDIGMSGFDVLMYALEDGAWVCIRPSGTEPKLKLYAGASAQSEKKVDENLVELIASLNKLIGELMN
ncbi:MAG: phospho-sugar mutase [Clostridia bacterium]